MLQLQSAVGIFALLAIAWVISENRRAVAWKQAAVGLALTFAIAVSASEGPGRHPRLCSDQRCRRRHCRRHPCRHLVRVRLSRRWRAPLRAQGPGRGIRACAAGVATGAGHERSDHAAVLLAHPAADRAWLLLAARAHARGERRGRAVDRGQHLPRHGRGPAVHPPLSREPHPQRAVHGHDRRHGGHCRHRAGDLRDLRGAGDPRCSRPSGDCIGAGRPGCDPRQPDHGSRAGQDGGRLRTRGAAAGRVKLHGCDRQGNRRRARAAAQYLRHADRSGRAGAPRQCDHGNASRYRRPTGHPPAPARLRDGAVVLAARPAVEGGGDGGHRSWA